MQLFSTMVGASFRPAEAKTIIRGLSVDDMVQLTPEFDNAYDSNAIQCFYDDVHISYLDRNINAPVALAFREGGNAVARIIDFENPLKPVLMIETTA